MGSSAVPPALRGRVGWFVVGAGRNGVEYSVLLMLCLTVIAMTRTTALRMRKNNK